MSRFGVVLLVAMSLIIAPWVAGAADLKIGVIDSNDILTKSPDGKRVQESLKRKAEELGKPFSAKRQDLAKQMEEFQKQASVMKEDARKRRAEELEKKLSDLDRQGQDAQKQMAQMEEKELAPLFKKLEQAVETVAREDKIDLVLDKRSVILNNKALDITEKVRSKFR